MNPYDEVEYDSKPFYLSHPERLATVSTLFGFKPVPIDYCKVLELGCSSGGNLIPMSEQLPGAKFVGIDSSKRAISKGQEEISDLQLKNIDLYQMDVLDFDVKCGEFDYIIAYGLFSWVPRSVQDKVLDICFRHLSGQGLALINYNAYPGWHSRLIIRDIAMYHANQFDNLSEKVKRARNILEIFRNEIKDNKDPYSLLMLKELDTSLNSKDYYFAHDYMEETNEPIYFSEFIDRVHSQGLQYVGDLNINYELEKMRLNVNSDPDNIFQNRIRYEQYVDMIHNTMFRQTIICKNGVYLEQHIENKIIEKLYLSTDANASADVDIHSRNPVRFARPSGDAMTISDPIIKAAMLELAERWPERIHFSDLMVAARKRVRPGAVLLGSDSVTQEEKILSEVLLRCFGGKLIDLSIYPARFSRNPSKFPSAFGVARRQALNSNVVTNLEHRLVTVTKLQRQLLQWMDGGHDGEAMVEKLSVLINGGALLVHDDGKVITDVNRKRELIGEIVERNLVQLGAMCLIVESTGRRQSPSAEQTGSS